MTLIRQSAHPAEIDVEHWLDELDPETTRTHDATPHRRIVAARRALSDAEDALRSAVAEARTAGYPWAMIGASLGVSRQAAQQRFGEVRHASEAAPKSDPSDETASASPAGSGFLADPRGNVVSSDGEELGTVGHIYLDNSAGNPVWITVKTGLFGSMESFVPLEGAAMDGDGVTVGWDRATIVRAPKVDPDGSLSSAEEDGLYEYYGLGSGSAADVDDDLSTSERQDPPRLH